MRTERPTTTYRWNPRVACRTLDGTAFVLLDSRMVRLNAVGTRMWELLEQGATLKTVRLRIVKEFDVEARRAAADLQAFVDALQARGLLVRGA